MKKSKTVVSKKSNLPAMLAYIIGPIYLLIEKKDKTIRFHAWQATFLWIASFALNYLLFAFKLGFLESIVNLGELVLWIVLVIKTLQGEKIVLPVIGEMAEKRA